MTTDPNETVARFEITGDLGRRDAESLRLHIRAIAKRCGVDLALVRFEVGNQAASGQTG
jgi:hypothetical protein